MLDIEPARLALPAVALFSIVLVRLPALLGHPHVLHPIVIGIFVWSIVGAASHRYRQASRAAAAMSFFYAGTVAVSVLRGAGAGVYNSAVSAALEGALYFALVCFALTLITGSRDSLELNKRLLCLALAPAVYSSTNLALYWIGVRPRTSADATNAPSVSDSPATLLGHLGLHLHRVDFPMASGVNLFGIISAAALTGVIVLMVRTPYLSRWVLSLGALACLLCVLLTDSRAPLLASLAVSVYFIAGRRTRGSTWIGALIPGLPLLAVGAVSLLDSAGVSNLLSRGGRNAFLSANGRTEIWRISWGIFKHPDLHQLVGWGALGQVTSGASFQWAHEFIGVVADPAAASSHNLAIQTLFDSGYIGLAALVGAATLASVQLRRYVAYEPGSPSAALLASLIVILLCGATEASPGYSAQEALVATLLFMGAAAGLGFVPRAVSTSLAQPHALDRALVEHQVGR